MKIKLKIGDKVYCDLKKEFGIIETIIDDLSYVNFKIENKDKEIYKKQKRYFPEAIMLRDLKIITKEDK